MCGDFGRIKAISVCLVPGLTGKQQDRRKIPEREGTGGKQ